MVRLDLGGGTKPKEGYINVDILECADVKCDLNEVARGTKKLPFEDNSVDEVYSSHCFEHLESPGGVLHEICRVCKVNSKVEIRIPHWAGSQALLPGHNYTLSYADFRQICKEFINDWWPKDKHKKRLHFIQEIKIPSRNFRRAQQLFPSLSADDIMTFIQDTCHESQFICEVVENI